jgi:hypothetical protein
VHIYLYAHADPINGWDPSGETTVGTFTMAVGTWGYVAANAAIRAGPVLNRATVLLFQATTGEAVILGGGAAVGASAAMSRVEGGIATWMRAVGDLKGVLVGTKAYLSEVLRSSGRQANHLNQAGAYTRIDYDYGACVDLVGSVFSRLRTEHLQLHSIIELFWNQYRKGGARYGGCD